MKILVAGDLAVLEYYDAGINLSPEIVELFNSSNLNIVNLEAPVTESPNKVVKTGPNLKSNIKSVLSVLKTLRIDTVTLANNHLMDYGSDGLFDTLAFCGENGISKVGAGRNLEEATKTLYIESESGTIAIINFAENEWGGASPDKGGFNPMDIINNTHEIRKAKKKADFVFVIIHGGHEHYNLPSPRMVKQYRFYAEEGADIIIGHHPHCVSGHEVYKGTPIYYSLGNFLFTKTNKNLDWYNGLILEIKIENKMIIPSLIPIKQSEDTYYLAVQKDLEKDLILKRISDYSDILKNDHKLLARWNDYVNLKSNSYQNYWSPLSFIKNKYLRGVLQRLSFLRKKTDDFKMHLNLLRCESHYDLSKEVMSNKLKNENSDTQKFR